MIYGRIADWPRDKAYYPPVWDRAFAFLEGRDPATLADGKYPVDGEKIFASVQTVRTEEQSARRFEAHGKYLDIQLLLSGGEKQLHAPACSGSVLTEDRLRADDVAFYTAPEQYNTLLLSPGHYAVYFPGELHCPCCAARPRGESIRKIVFKIQWPC